MTHHKANPVSSRAETGAAPVDGNRKPYCKPSFTFERVFETMALQCGKVQGTSGACNVVKMAS